MDYQMTTSKINIKPLSVNQAHRTVGNRILKSKAYKEYEQELFYILPNFTVPESKLELCIEVGLSNKLSDIDNIVKPFVDVLQKKYDFNDRMIYKLTVHKFDIKKGEEYIKFGIGEY